ncbi:MAG: UDP-glucose 4-epimerase GalE [Endozoicomonas sp. (ex Botrylloides leachii)]|nr:UDP-glucose 4-epimerase GalE [Endozoicomonas sp. (ex Botrylloides leachii)]
MHILVTGGAGYIGSHICVELLTSGHDIVVFDNLCNSAPEALKRIEQITGKYIPFIKGDIRDQSLLSSTFNDHDFDAVIHCAGLKSVDEAVMNPLKYYENNISGTITLCQVMAEHKCRHIIFSSSAMVYGYPDGFPIKENFPLSAINPYSHSKLVIEEILRELHKKNNDWNIAILRYFNPAGAHCSGMIGESPNGTPNNLMSYISQVATGHSGRLKVFGDDYPTKDGTKVRDYIHVVDLARGHVSALEKLLHEKKGVHVWNLGVGKGFSVLEIIKAFEAASGEKLTYKVTTRRPSDIAICYVDPGKAERELGWKAEYTLEDIVADLWRRSKTS